MQTLGMALKSARQAQHLTQHQVAQDICAQSMLSAIEHDRYVPNARLLLALCQRLNVAVSALKLADNFAISADASFNHRVEMLCNAHQYQALKDFLLAPATLTYVQTDEQTQAYYYYLGIACWQVDAMSADAIQHIQLALGMATPNAPLTTLSRLALISLAVFKTAHYAAAHVETLVTQALQDIEAGPYEENLNIVYYLAGLVAYQQHAPELAMNRLTAGIAFATAHNSHYMLANCYQLLAQLALEANDTTAAQQASERSAVFRELFHEQVHDEFG